MAELPQEKIDFRIYIGMVFFRWHIIAVCFLYCMLGGVLFWFSGPTYETPAEARMVQVLGGDAATMSTLPENVASWSAGVRSAALSLITNHVTPNQPCPTRHSEVVEVAERAGEKLRRLLEDSLASWDRGVE